MDPQRRNYVHNIPAARALRDRQTPTEAVMWQALRGRRAGGWKFRRQHAVGRFVLDFYCHALRLAVEIDGGIHNSAEQTALDHERQAELEQSGLRFYRIRTSDIERNLDDVLAKLDAHIATLHPPP